TNISTNKWRDLIAPGTDMPTMPNPDCTQKNDGSSPVPPGTVGTFEGATITDLTGSFGVHCGLYRPEYLCIMSDIQTPGRPPCAVCQRRIRETLAPYLPGVEP